MKRSSLLPLLTASLGLACALSPSGWAQTQLTYVDLVRRLTDLERLASLPDEGEKCLQWSSYDRASKYDEKTGKYVGWDANGDGGGIIRREGDQLVLAEMKGPGCLWRIWSAAPKQGHVRIFLDDGANPAVDLPFMGYFDRKNAPFTRGAIVHTAASGWNNYTPIPFQKSCRIVAERGWGDYYQFNYSTFAPGTRVPTFRRELNAEENAALDEANRLLSSSGPGRPKQAGEEVGQVEGSASGGGRTGLTLDGPRAITTLRAKLELPAAPADRAALREWTLQIQFDDEESPSVWAPFGDFFGTAAGANAYDSLPAGLSKDGWWYCHWYMPFARRAQIYLKNDGPEKARVRLEVVHAPLKTEAAKLARFHAKWHRDAFLPAEKERWIDWPLLKTEGRGRFVGVMLHVWNPRGGWWGEGDEKFFVDGEKFPSTFGTGSEDYFGYAWCNPTLFQNAYHNQTISMGNKGHVSVNRWQITENIPFHTAFEADIEKYYPNARPTLYAATVFWYLQAGGKDPYEAQPLGVRTGYWTDIQSFKVKGALEGERLKQFAKTGGNAAEQDMGGYTGQWSGDSHLWWTGAKPGQKLELAIPVETAGPSKLTLQLTKARDYGIVQLYLDDQKLGGPVDCYDPEVVPSGALTFSVGELAAGQHKLTLEVVGANDKAVKAYMAGLDYVKLEPAR